MTMMQPSTKRAAAGVLLIACFMVLLVAAQVVVAGSTNVRGAAAATPAAISQANDLAARKKRLARLLNEGPTGPQLLTPSECDALPVFMLPSQGICGNSLNRWAQWPLAEGYCGLDIGITDTTLSGANAACTAAHSSGKLWAPASDAERCGLTHIVDLFTTPTEWYYSGITDAETDGVWKGPDGEAIESLYINWARGNPMAAPLRTVSPS